MLTQQIIEQENNAMKNKLFAILLISAMLMSPAAVFADDGSQAAADGQAAAENTVNEFGSESPEQPAVTEGSEVTEEPTQDDPAPVDPSVQTGWDETRDHFYDSEGNLVTGLFKAGMYQHDEILHLYYADETGEITGEIGKVVKESRIINVPGDKKRYIYKTELDGFDVVDSSDTNAYTYFIKATSTDNYIVSTSGVYKGDNNKKYFVQKNGTVKTSQGFGTYTNSSDNKIKVFVQKDGTVRTKEGMLKYDGGKYYVKDGGAIYTKVGILTYSGHKYIVSSTSGKIRTKVGVCTLKTNGKRYYVAKNTGVLAKNKSAKYKGNVYHVSKKYFIYMGRHKWTNGKLYYSDKYGALAKSKRIIKDKKGRYFVNKGGLIAVNTMIHFKKKTYIAAKNGYFKTGFITYKGKLYYAEKNGEVRTKTGLFTKGDYTYYVGSGGAIHKNGIFTEKGKTYIANEKGHLLKGIVLWKGNYYYVADNYEVRTKEGIWSNNGKFYFIQNGGRMVKSAFITYNGKHYYAGSNAEIYTTTFKYMKYTITPSRTGEISDADYYKIFPNEKKSND